MSVRYLVGEVVHFGHRIDARDVSEGDESAVRLFCERRKFMGALYGRGQLTELLYRLRVDVWIVEDPVDCMTCLVLDARRA